MFRAILAACLAAGLTACATPRDPNVVNTPGYAVGFNDGCETAYLRQDPFSRKTARNDNQYQSDETYRIGWREGYIACGGKRVATDPSAESQSRWYSGGPNQ